MTAIPAQRENISSRVSQEISKSRFLPALWLKSKLTHLKGKSERAITSAGSIPAAGQRSLLVKPGIVNASRFVLRSFRGQIHVIRP